MRLGAVCCSLAAGLAAVTGCSREVPVEPPPSPQASAASACTALAAALPEEVNGHQRRATSPRSDLTAAWGDPAITLRCGVGEPPQLSPTSELATVNGVDWLPIELTQGYRFVTTGRVAFVEVDVPDHYEPELNEVVDLATPIAATVPLLPTPTLDGGEVTEDPAASPAPS